MPACDICGGESFTPGPNGRLARSGAPPRCAGCGSLERHRALRECLERVPRAMLSWRRAIQFAPDPSLDPSWFASYEGSHHGGENSLDLEKIDRPEDSYDFISLSSVLEFVPDDRRAFRELLRISSPDCVIHCTFTPLAETTLHSAEPHGAFGRFHQYGLDLGEWFEVRSHGLNTLIVMAIDPATGEKQPVTFFCLRERDADALRIACEAGEPAFDVSIQT